MSGMVQVVPARLDWLEALEEGDDVFAQRFGRPVEADWAGFPEAVPHAVELARVRSADPWGTHLFFDDGDDGALVGFGGFKGAPTDGVVELGYAVAPARQRRGIATAVVEILLERARAAGATTVIAHTLAGPNPSTGVLDKTGFRHTGSLDDDGVTVWRWERPAAT
jgi:ribosomal-protein-alanine N-acetyltransferase